MIPGYELLKVCGCIVAAVLIVGAYLQLNPLESVRLNTFAIAVVLLVMLLLGGCVMTSPNVDPSKYLYPGSDSQHFGFDEATYNVAVAERKRLQTRQRWSAIGCDIVTTIACVASGRGAELGGNALIPVKFGIGYLAQRKANELDEQGYHIPLKIVNSAHLAACVANIVTCRL